MNDGGGAGGGIIGALMGLGLFGMIVAMIVAMIVVFGLPLYTCAQKLGHDKPWLAFVPIGNAVLALNLADMSGWLVLIAFVPLVNLLFLLLFIYCWMKIAEKMGHPGWLAILMVVPLLGLLVPFYIAYAAPSQAQRY